MDYKCIKLLKIIEWIAKPSFSAHNSCLHHFILYMVSAWEDEADGYIFIPIAKPVQCLWYVCLHLKFILHKSIIFYRRSQSDQGKHKWPWQGLRKKESSLYKCGHIRSFLRVNSQCAHSNYFCANNSKHSQYSSRPGRVQGNC